MNWVSFSMGIITVLLTYAFFSSALEEEQEEIAADKEAGVVVNDLSGRYVTLSCQTCRKLKKHREVETNLYQCTKCKRHVDLR
jgi:acetyl-CoA carboxylase beta subunit